MAPFSTPKPIYLGLIFFTIISFSINAQVGINTNSPDSSSILDITSDNKGLLIPRVSILDLSTIAPITGGSTESLLVYNTNVATEKGFYYWDGSDWIGLKGSGGGSSNDDWDLIGNAGTDPSTNYIGTSNNQPLAFRTNDTEYMRLLTDGSLGLGTTTTGDGSVLDIDSATKGVLIPRVDIIDLATIAPITGVAPADEAAAEGLLVYNTNSSTTVGFYYWDGSKWVKLAQGSSDDWTTTGNSGTTPAGNFIGTTDDNGFAFRTNNVERMRLTEEQYVDGNGISWAYLGVGTTTPGEIFDVNGDADFGGDFDNWDGLSETIKLRAESNSFFMGVKNDPSNDESDFFIGLTDDPDEAAFRIEPSGDVSIGKDDDDPQAILHITKDQDENTAIRIDNENGDGGPTNVRTAVELWAGADKKASFRYKNGDDFLEIMQHTVGGEIDVYIGSSVIMNIDSGGVNVTGDVNVTGNISKGAGTFKIDHPLDPENKYLYHSFVESPDMLNIYNGNVTTNEDGIATVALPDYFSALNKDYKYQLSAVNSFSEVMVLEEVKNNSFIIQSELPNVKISWQVTGVRQDPYANNNRVQPEVEKEAFAKGKYLYPEAYNLGKEKGIKYNQDKK